MFDLDKWQEIWATLSRNKLRTTLTGLGVVWGIFMLVATVAFARGFRTGMNNQLSGFANNSVYVWGQRTTMPYQGLPPGREVEFTNDDSAAVARIHGIEHFGPRIQLGGWRDSNNITRGSKSGNFQIFGDFPAMAKIMNMEILAGRYLNELDVEERRKVVVLGIAVREALFELHEDPIGQYIKARGVYFQVIGVFKPRQAGDDGDRDAQTVMIPFTTFQQAFNAQNEVGFFAVTVDPSVPAPEVEKEIRRILAERHKVHPDDPEGIGSFNWAVQFKKIQTVFIGMEGFTWVASVFTLLAGVLGVSNILLISVKERTKEIGVRKALGATPNSIVRMIVQESIALTTIAGYAGLVFGVGFLEFVGLFIDGTGEMAKPQLDFGTAVISVVVLVGSGALAGIIPARHAARIPPVEALRAEQ